MKNQTRISKINDLYYKLILSPKEITLEYYASLKINLILEKITGILTSEVDFESADKRYYTFEYEDFKILHDLLINNKKLQNGIEYIYSMTISSEIPITRLIIKLGIDQYLYFECLKNEFVTAEVIFFDDTNMSEDDSKISLENIDSVSQKLSSRPSKIFNILEYLAENIDYELLNSTQEENETSEKYTFRNFVKETNVPICSSIPNCIFTEPRPTIKCSDGFKFSVQASAYNNCEPKLTGLDIYKSFEVLSRKDIDELALYLSNDNYIGMPKKKNSIRQYNFVPLNLIEEIIGSHGGIDKESTFDIKTTNLSELQKLSYVKKKIETETYKEKINE